MKHYLHIAFYVTIHPEGQSISDAFLELENQDHNSIREAVQRNIEESLPDGFSLRNSPTIISISELSKDLYETLTDHGSRETQENEG